MKKKVILDVDPGIDDAIAIIVALQSKDMDVIGITTVNGNVGSRVGALNALKILGGIGTSNKIPVIQGAPRPLVKRAIHSEEIHGAGGLGGFQLDIASKLFAKKTKFSEFIESTAASYRKGEVSLIATGPLTNIANLFLGNSHALSSLGEISIMGGAFGFDGKTTFGNATNYAEFNFYCDPEAAKVVLSENSSVSRRVVVGLDTTSNPLCLIDTKSLNKMLNLNSPSAKIAASLLNFAISKHGVFHLHDVFAVVMHEKPSFFKFKKGNIGVTLKGRRRGHSEFNEDRVYGKILVAAGVHVNEFNNYLLGHFMKN